VKSDEEFGAATETLALIEKGGPYPYRKDGSVFSNREGRLPSKPRGYYREFTVPTSGEGDRGARRIIRGGQGETYYTRDHYATFTRIDG
jgi:ribonuclease T1